MITERKPHRLCALMRPLTEEEYTELLDSYETHGPRDARIIVDQNGEIIDGYHTDKALRELGIDPEPYVRVRDFKDDLERAEFIMSMQLGRRNDTAAARIAMAKTVLEGATMAPSAENIAEFSHTSLRNVRRFNRIDATGVVELRRAAREGKLSLDDAAALAMLPEAEQLEALRGGDAGTAGAVAKVRRMRSKPAAARRTSLEAAWALAPQSERDAFMGRIGRREVVSKPPAFRARQQVNACASAQPGGATSDTALSGVPDTDPDLRRIKAALAQHSPEEQKQFLQDFFRWLIAQPASEGGFDGDGDLLKDWIWFYVADDEEREKYLHDHPEAMDQWRARDEHKSKARLDAWLDQNWQSHGA